jgi:hypothetical protein
LNSFRKYPIIPYQNIPSPSSAGSTSTTSATATSPSPHSTAEQQQQPKDKEMKIKSQNIPTNNSNLQIPIGNGGISENYYWTQTLKEITVYIDLPYQAKGKEIQCVITPSHLTLTARGQLLLNDDFEEKVCVDESMWTIATDSHETNTSDKGSQVILTLEKCRKTWWKHVLISDPEIDTTKVSPSLSLSLSSDLSLPLSLSAFVSLDLFLPLFHSHLIFVCLSVYMSVDLPLIARLSG